jgi:hypothetical protein
MRVIHVPPLLEERIRRMKPSRFEPMNHKTCEIFSLAPIGGEGRGEGVSGYSDGHSFFETALT